MPHKRSGAFYVDIMTCPKCGNMTRTRRYLESEGKPTRSQCGVCNLKSIVVAGHAKKILNKRRDIKKERELLKLKAQAGGEEG